MTRFKCSTCGKRFRKEIGCKDHIRNVHTKKGGEAIEVTLADREDDELPEVRMSFKDAMDFVDDDLPDGAYWAMCHEMAGLEYGDGFAELAEDDE